jgi:hypothetical protein
LGRSLSQRAGFFILAWKDILLLVITIAKAQGGKGGTCNER